MTTFAKPLRQSKDAIIARWLDDVLAAYGDDSAAVFKRQKDPFANPVGHSLRTAAPEIFQALLDGVDAGEMDPQKLRPPLHQVIQIRAVQELSASGAVGFVFRLKQAIRTELGKAAEDPLLAPELTEVEAQIDRIALVAFDVYVECRQRLCELRINELKRTVPWVVGKKKGKRGKGEKGKEEEIEIPFPPFPSSPITPSHP